jgi:hypothetical protein
MAAQPDLFGVTASDVAVAGSQRVVRTIEALPPVLDPQAVVGLYEQLGQQLTHEQEPGITALRNVRPGTVVRPAGALPPAGPAAAAAEGRGPLDAMGRSGSMSRHPAGRNLPAGGSRAGAPAGIPAGRRGGKAKAHPGGTSGGKLALLAAFVIFAVYILPYLAR